LMVLDTTGKVLHDVPLPDPERTATATEPRPPPRCTTSTVTARSRSSSRPSITAWTCSRSRVPRKNCVLWPTARGGPLRSGRAQ
jgi:hypothetical protein